MQFRKNSVFLRSSSSLQLCYCVNLYGTVRHQNSILSIKTRLIEDKRMCSRHVPRGCVLNWWLIEHISWLIQVIREIWGGVIKPVRWNRGLSMYVTLCGEFSVWYETSTTPTNLKRNLSRGQYKPKSSRVMWTPSITDLKALNICLGLNLLS